MNFRNIALKNFRFHARKYLSFFLCNSFAIMILFMFSTLLFNSKLSENVESTTIDMLQACVISIIVFFVFFLSYASSTFMKSRNSEFGLFMILGMKIESINKLMLIENASIAGLSLFIGLITGSIFSRLFFMVAVSILNNNSVSFELNPSEYIFTIAFFVAVFLVITFISYRNTKNFELVKLLKANRKSEKAGLQHPVLEILSVLVLAFAYVLLYLDSKGIYRNRVLEIGTSFTLTCLIGLYIFISQFGSTALKLLHINKRFYYKNILSLTEIRYKLTSCKKIVYIISIFNALVMFFVGSSFSNYITGSKSSQKDATLLMFLMVFLSMLFILSSSIIIYFKLFNELDDEKTRYKKLFSLGISFAEVKKYLSVELKVLFVIPFSIGVAIILPYFMIDNINNSSSVNIGYFGVIILIYLVFQLSFYYILRRSYLKSVIKDC